MTEQLGLFESEAEVAARQQVSAAETWEAQFDRAEWVYPEDGATGAQKGDVLLGWICPTCGTLEPTDFTLQLNHGWHPQHVGRVGWCRRALPKLFGSTARGVQARVAEFEAWKDGEGNFDCIRISHAWTAGMTTPTDPTETCQPTVLDASLSCHHTRDHQCSCVGGRLHRGFCRGCDWEAETDHDHETLAIFDALDHAHPGWRDSPIIEDSPPMDEKRRGAWTAKVVALYGDRPDGWPVITERLGGLRAVPGRSPWGGYDVAADSLGES